MKGGNQKPYADRGPASFDKLLSYSFKLDFSQLSEALSGMHQSLQTHDSDIRSATEIIQGLRADKEDHAAKLSGLVHSADEHTVS